MLDVGFGDGAFLENARLAGCTVQGVDIDPVVVEKALTRGLNVQHGRVESLAGSELFDLITISHVIEHVHEPASVFRACHRLLKEGGQLWLETPNIKSKGHSRFGSNWFGLDTPRHLVLFNRKSIEDALLASGFVNVRDIPQPRVASGVYRLSSLIEGSSASIKDARRARSVKLRLEALFFSAFEPFLGDSHEFLAVTATKKTTAAS